MSQSVVCALPVVWLEVSTRERGHSLGAFMGFPFTALHGADAMAHALILAAISPEIGGVLVRGEKGTAKSTMVRALAEVMPLQQVVAGCRYGCDPADPDPDCPDGDLGGHGGVQISAGVPTTVPARELAPAGIGVGGNGDLAGLSAGQTRDKELFGAAARQRPTPLVELPVGATEARVIGALDVAEALAGNSQFLPGLLAEANRGLLYIDEVNLLGDHLVDVLLDAAAMGRNTVERDGVSVSHAARIVLIGTMNPEEGELRPQLLDRFGLTVEVKASREVAVRTQIVRRRLDYDTDPAGFTARYAGAQAALTRQIASARRLLPQVQLSEWALEVIARVCAGFAVDGMRADIVTARAAMANAAWEGRKSLRRKDIRAAALLTLPHRRRRNPFDELGIDEDLLDELLGDDDGPDDPPGGEEDLRGNDGGDNAGESAGEEGTSHAEEGAESLQDPEADDSPLAQETSGSPADAADSPMTEKVVSAQDSLDAHEQQIDGSADGQPGALAPIGVAAMKTGYQPRVLRAQGTGSGSSGRRSAAISSSGRVIGSRADQQAGRQVHVLDTALAAAARRSRRQDNVLQKDSGGRFLTAPIVAADLRYARMLGKEANLVLFAVDASGSMAARRRMEAVKSAVLALLVDAYQRRDRVAVVSFRGDAAHTVLPPTNSIEIAVRRLEKMEHGGRTPLAEGLEAVAEILAQEHRRNAQRRPIVVFITDGRATAGKNAWQRAESRAEKWSLALAPYVATTYVIDCESGRFRLGLAKTLAGLMGAEYLPLEDVAAQDLQNLVSGVTTREVA